MPEKPEVLTVNIHKTPEGCAPDHPFVAKPGSTVVFAFAQAPDATIKILGTSPFDEPEFPLGPHKVRANAARGPVKYRVSWGTDKQGNGSGEVIPV